LSRKNDKEIKNIEGEIGRQSNELIKECKQVLAQEETLQANLDVCNERRKVRRSLHGDSSNQLAAEAINYDACALDNSNVLSLDTLREEFNEGVEKGPEEEDALSRLFDEDSGLMTHLNMKKLFRFFQNVGWDRSPSFPAGKKIRVDRIRSTVHNDEGRMSQHICESVQQMNLRLQLTIFGDEYLPAIGQNMKNRMTLEAAHADKLKEEENTNNHKRLAALPTSTKKRSLKEINPLAGNLLVQANTFCGVHSSAARKRTKTEEVDTGIAYSSPGGEKIEKCVYKTPEKKVIMILLAFLLPSQELGFPTITLIRRGVLAKSITRPRKRD